MPDDSTRPRFRRQLLWLIVAVAGPLVALLAWSGLREYRLMEAQARTRTLALADATATATRQFFSGATGFMEQVARARSDDLLDAERCEPLLTTLNGVVPFVVNLLMADAEGRVVCTVRENADQGLASVAGRAWFEEALASGRAGVGPPRVGLLTQRWIVAVSAPVPGPDGTVAGVLGGSVELARLQELLAGVSIGEDELVTIADGDLTVLARSEDEEAWIGRTIPPFSSPTTEVSPGRGVAGGVDLEGVERSWAQVDIPGLGWTVFSGVPRAQVYAPVVAALVRTGVVMLLGIGLALILGARIYRRIVDSLYQLVEGTRAAGEVGRVPIPAGAPAEVAQVADQFNQTLEARSRAEAGEREAQGRYRSIFENAVLGIVRATLDGQILDANPAFLKMLGYDGLDELKAVNIRDFYQRPEDRDEVMAQVEREGVLKDAELYWRRRDGTPVILQANGSTIHEEGRPPLAEVLYEDITQAKRLEVQLRHAQKMDAVGRLAGGVAHDFNNLLTVIEGNAELLLESLGDHPGRAEAHEIAEAAGRAAAVTRQLLTFSRPDQAGARVVELPRLIRDMDALLRRLIGTEIRLEVTLDPGVPRVRADPGHLEQVILNLVLNARDAVARDGTVTVRAFAAQDDQGRPGAAVQVTDDGAGMDAATQERIFEPFFTTKPKGRGTGLGLATVFGIVDQLGGRVEVESAPGEGATFTVWIPAAEVTNGEVEAPLDPEPSDGGTETILVVEDEPAVREMVRTVLERAGYRVLTAENGEEGLAMGRAEAVDLVVSDVVMPRMRGTEMARRLGEIRPALPVLLTTGYTEEESIDDLVARNPDALLRKPFKPSQLLERIRRILDRVSPTPPPDGRG